MAGKPLKRAFGDLGGGCVGKTRTGEPCRSLMLYICRSGARRCKWGVVKGYIG